MLGTRRSRCLWCGHDLRAPEVALCARCLTEWRVVTREPALLRDDKGNPARDEREAMAILATAAGLADDWLELDDDRVRVLTQHSRVEIGHDSMGRPLIFETIVIGGTDDMFVRRYATETEARAGHALVLAIYGAGHTLRGPR